MCVFRFIGWCSSNLVFLVAKTESIVVVSGFVVLFEPSHTQPLPKKQAEHIGIPFLASVLLPKRALVLEMQPSRYRE
jgi:hypothetical protein